MHWRWHQLCASFSAAQLPPALSGDLAERLGVCGREGVCEREGAREVARDEGRDFDRGLRAGLGKATKSADVKLVLATSESMSAPNRKKGLSFCSSTSAPGGAALGAEGAFSSGLPLATGMVESVVVESGQG